MSQPLFLRLSYLVLPCSPPAQDSGQVYPSYLNLAYTGLNSDLLGGGYIVNTACPFWSAVLQGWDAHQVWMERSLGLGEGNMSLDGGLRVCGTELFQNVGVLFRMAERRENCWSTAG